MAIQTDRFGIHATTFIHLSAIHAISVCAVLIFRKLATSLLYHPMNVFIRLNKNAFPLLPLILFWKIPNTRNPIIIFSDRATLKKMYGTCGKYSEITWTRITVAGLIGSWRSNKVSEKHNHQNRMPAMYQSWSKILSKIRHIPCRKLFKKKLYPSFKSCK